MTARTQTVEFQSEPLHAPRSRPQWRKAWRALQTLLDDPDDTQRALDVLEALDPTASQRDFARFLSRRTGRLLFEKRSSLGKALGDHEQLRTLPEGSLGRAYLDYLERWGLDAESLLELNWDHRARGRDVEDEGFAWYLDRSVVLHDVWHVLSGYGADDLGEAALLPFSLAQQGGLGRWFLTVGSVLRAWEQGGKPWPRHVWRAWRQGRHAADLAAVPYEELLAEPLSEVRRALGLRPPEEVHRGGVPVSEFSKLTRTAQPPTPAP